MRTETVISLIFASVLSLCVMVPADLAAQAEPTTIFLVRHAEKVEDSKDPELSEAGLQRAQDLALLLKDAGIARIYSSDFLRTRDTAAPLAGQSGLTVQIYDVEALEAFAASLAHSGQRVLVVGHSDTTPELVELLGGDPGEEIDEATEYNRLYVVTIGPDGAVTSLLLRYGVDSGP